jgi:hypothetical protein
VILHGLKAAWVAAVGLYRFMEEEVLACERCLWRVQAWCRWTHEQQVQYSSGT